MMIHAIPISLSFLLVLVSFFINPFTDFTGFIDFKNIAVVGAYQNLASSSIVSLLYPTIAEIVMWLSGDIQYIFIPQMLFYAYSCVYLWFILHRYFGKIILLFWVPLLCNPYCFIFAFRVGSDSFFYSLVILITAEIIRVFYDKDKLWYRLAILIGLCVVLRIAAVALIPILIVMYFFHYHHKKQTKNLCIALLIIMSMFFGEKIVHKAYHQDKASSLLHITLFGKASVIAAKQSHNILPNHHLDAVLTQALQEKISIFRPIINNYPRYCMTNIGTQLEVIFQQYGGLDEFTTLPRATIIDIILSNIDSYITISLCHYVRGWLIMPQKTLFFNEVYYDGVQQLHDVSKNSNFEQHIKSRWQNVKQKKPNIIITLIMMGYVIAGMSTFLAIIIRFIYWRTYFSPHINLTFLLSMLVHGYLLFIALANVAIQRYSLAMTSVLIVIFTIWLITIYKYVTEQRILRQQ